MKIKKRIFSLALAGALALGLVPAFSMTALADGDTSYTLTIPSTLTVADKGWNATSGISATGTLATGKKLTVTAESTNGWKLVSGSNNVGYTLTTASGGNQTTSWEFTTLDGTAQPMGIIVENYDGKPAGTYTDTVTFTASVASTLTYIEVGKKPYATLDDVRFYYIPGETYRQAVQNHGTENGSNWKFGEWSTTNHTIYYGGNGNGNLYIDNDDAFAPGQGSCELTLDSVVDPNRTYTHDIE